MCMCQWPMNDTHINYVYFMCARIFAYFVCAMFLFIIIIVAGSFSSFVYSHSAIAM